LRWLYYYYYYYYYLDRVACCAGHPSRAVGSPSCHFHVLVKV
jgi:hypothetical protein